MSIRNLEALFKPRSIVLVGGTDREGSTGAVLTRNVLDGGFRGPIYIVNRHSERLPGHTIYPTIEALPEAPDLAIIVTPPPSVPTLIDALGRKGCSAAVVITAGFAENGGEGAALQQAILDAAAPYLMRVMGPNCLGLLLPNLGLNASFAHLSGRRGRLAFISQSGAILTSMLDWAESRRIGFSSLLSLGNMADVDTGDLLDYLALDRDTDAILLYGESTRDARKFMSAARGAARAKPVIVVKAGRHAAGARAAASHTAALAGSDAVYDAAFRRAGMLRVKTLEELFDAAEVLSASRTPQGRHVAVVTNGGGLGVLTADALLDEDAKLADLAPETLAALDAALPPTWSHGNPVDIIGDAPPERYTAALEPVLNDPNVNVVLALNCPTALAPSLAAAEAVAGCKREHGPVLLTSWIGEHEAAQARRLLAERGIPCYPMPHQAVRAFMYLYRYRRAQTNLMETPASIPASFEPDTAAARAVIQKALDRGRSWLDEVDSKAVLEAYRIPTVASFRVDSAAAAAARAAEINRPVALKVLSQEILHKSEAGAVLLDIAPSDVEQVAESLLERIAKAFPDARVDGLSVQAMVDRRDAYELFAGLALDPVFGPVVLFGEGGEAVEVIHDQSIGLPPLNMHLAMEMIRLTRVNKLLKGFRSRAPVDREAVAFTLVKLAQLAADLPEVQELDVNPIVAGPGGVTALDARVRVAPAQGSPTARLTIRPYPSELERKVTLKDGEQWPLRPLRPEDEPAIQRMFARMTPEEVRFRFMGPVKTLTHAQAARYSQLDYDREMAFVLLDRSGPEEEIAGVVRISADPDNQRAEYAILVLRPYTGHGMGRVLMERIIEYARERGIGEIYGSVLADNAAMLALCRHLGFTLRRDPDDMSVMGVRLSLQEGGSR